MLMSSNSFSPYRCDRNIALGINLNSLTKVLRAAQNDDILTIKAEDAPDSVNLTFENADSDRISEYDIKLMDIDQEHLGIPETSYAATIAMPSAEFQRICRDLSALSESGKSISLPLHSYSEPATPPPTTHLKIHQTNTICSPTQSPSNAQKKASPSNVPATSATAQSRFAALQTSKTARRTLRSLFPNQLR